MVCAAAEVFVHEVERLKTVRGRGLLLRQGKLAAGPHRFAREGQELVAPLRNSSDIGVSNHRSIWIDAFQAQRQQPMLARRFFHSVLGKERRRVAATDREDLNVFSCLLAKKEGAKRTVALVYQTELEYVVQDTGIDTLINPKRVTVNAIVNRATSTDEIEGMEELEGGDASVREFLIKNKNGKTGKKLSSLNLPEDTLIAMINRDGEAIFPDSESVLEEKDHVLVFTLKNKLPEVENFFH